MRCIESGAVLYFRTIDMKQHGARGNELEPEVSDRKMNQTTRSALEAAAGTMPGAHEL